MLESSASPLAPSDDLVRQLSELQLCRSSDLRRARTFVRRLARDLPAFDSVWVDALVQMRRLTPYQARMLEERASAGLRIGPYVIVDELGRGPHAVTYLARQLDRRERCVVKRLRVPVEQVSECRHRLELLLERSAGWSHPHLVLPHSSPTCGERELATVSRWISGVPLNELLVRRGRFPASIVLEVGRQLLDGLASLDSRGLVHGDIRLSNARLTDCGLVVLVDGGIRPAMFPELTIHQSFALEGYDGIAPELIGTGAVANASTELYAVGCLLWQLLAGRPPYPMADPLMKLAAHQTRRIEDVRNWAPDTPKLLAESILSMTSPCPEERPRSFDELLQRWGRPGAMTRSRLRCYRRLFDGAVPHLSQLSPAVTSGRWGWIAATLFVASGAVVTLADKGLRNDVLSLTTKVTQAVRSREVHSTPSASAAEAARTPNQAAKTREGLLPLPSPSADGEIVLAEAGPYEVADVAANGSLVIRGAAGIRPVLREDREPLRLAAESVSLSNVSIHRSDSTAKTAPAGLVLVRSQRATVDGCEFRLGLDVDSSDSEGSSSAALAWLPIDDTSGESGQIEFRNTMIIGSGVGVLFAQTPRFVNWANCLKVGRGAAMTLSRKASAREMTLELEGLTLRESGPLIRFGGAFAEENSAASIRVIANDCVFAISRQNTALVEVQVPHARSDVGKSVAMTGSGSVIVPDTVLMSLVDPARGIRQTLADADEQFEGLIASDVEFAGAASADATRSAVVRLSAPRSSNKASFPGIDSSHLQSPWQE